MAFIGLESVGVGIGPRSKVPSGFAVVGDDEFSPVLELDWPAELLKDLRDKVMFLVLWELKENGIVNLHEDLNLVLSPYV